MRARLRPRVVLFDAAILLVTFAFVVYSLPRVQSTVASAFQDITAQLTQLIPSASGTRAIELPNGGAVVTAADPIAQGLPDFTREPALTLSGHIPAFAVADGRTVEVALNGAVVATLTPDGAGAFTTPLTLREGPNAIALTLLAGKDIVAHSSYTVVLDRQPPTVVVNRPKSGDTVDGPNVVVEGRADAGATVVVNDRTIVPAQDGTFTEFVTANPGPMTITVLVRDRAGNETTVKTPITVRAGASAGPLTVSVTLDKTRVVPGGVVTATIVVLSNGRPQVGQQVTLSVGVITIGSAATDAGGLARISFAAPPNEGDASVVVIAAGASGRAALTVAK